MKPLWRSISASASVLRIFRHLHQPQPVPRDTTASESQFSNTARLHASAHYDAQTSQRPFLYGESVLLNFVSDAIIHLLIPVKIEAFSMIQGKSFKQAKTCRNRFAPPFSLLHSAYILQKHNSFLTGLMPQNGLSNAALLRENRIFFTRRQIQSMR